MEESKELQTINKSKRVFIGAAINDFHGNTQKQMLERIENLKKMLKVSSNGELIKVLIVSASNFIFEGSYKKPSKMILKGSKINLYVQTCDPKDCEECTNKVMTCICEHCKKWREDHKAKDY